ncbi:GntR family transcriptional regulator [Saccharomonospora sp. CUA-673]|uniref:GntR family transcriptional regulator n=1 Tax=Saccharomonospora sp. CUA-673 TaxID=1904969 RepID=UPI0021007766|nr:GntR family transcriptional regulator [Saccharomonospora sp. CUA-673]
MSPGSMLPPVSELATRYHVSTGTAHRAIAELKSAGYVAASRGKRATVTYPSEPSEPEVDTSTRRFS